MSRAIELGFSSCPNDTFMFHGLVSGDVPVEGVTFEPVIEDIEALNLRALGEGDAPPLAVTKLSVGALGHVTDRYAVLQSGAALGRGVGPLVVRRADGPRPHSLADLAGERVAVPGLRTTAYQLFRMFAPANVDCEPMRFDRIMPAVAEGRVAAGVIIHEGRFTYGEHGLERIADLGDVWEEATGLPLPLGVIAALRDLEPGLAARIDAGLRTSIERAFADPQRSRAFVREHAQELSDEVCDRHIALYVNDFSLGLGEQGRAAIGELLRRGAGVGLFPDVRDPTWVGPR